MTNNPLSPHDGGSILGQEIEKRLAQLGLSRREFARGANIGRQTLHEIIHNPNKRISDKTFAALDRGLKWEAGVAKAFHSGNQDARQTDMSIDERINTYILQILQRLGEMNIDQLEREVLMLESESSGRTGESETSRLIERQISKLVASLMNHPNRGGTASGHEIEQAPKPPNNRKGASITAGK